MPHDTTCIQCGRAGFVRMERVIKGLELQLSYYCGACDHTWQVRQEDPRVAQRRATLREKPDRRKH
jgi:hypothetical protein